MPAKRQPSAEEMLRWIERMQLVSFDFVPLKGRASKISWRVGVPEIPGRDPIHAYGGTFRAALRAAMAAERKERTRGKR